jgi:imidazolonepropionase
MKKLLLKNIKLLLSVYEKAPLRLKGEQMNQLPVISDAWLAAENGEILDYGSMDDFPGIADWKDLEIIDCDGKIVMPTFADSHTHIVYAGNREQEFVDRINGLSYEEIAAKGGGILNSAELLSRTNEDELFEQSKQRLLEVIALGTGAIEIKSGYGLSLDSELKILRVIKRLKELNLIPIKATFLGAHAVPKEYKNNKKEYIELIVKEMLPAIVDQKLADYIDVFCEQNYFTADETTYILSEGAKYGLKGKVHAEQLSHSGGISAAVECKAISVDHLEYCSDEDITKLLNSDTMPTILPGAAYFLNLPLPPAKKMIKSGLSVAFASDYNPGSSPSGNMMQMLSMACVQYKLTPEEAINSVTVNTAYAMGCEGLVGTITRGKLCNLIITKPITSYSFLPYAFGSQLIDSVIINGEKF